MRRTFKQRIAISAISLLLVLISSLSEAAPSCNQVYNQSPAFYVLKESFLKLQNNDFPFYSELTATVPTVKSESRISTAQGDLLVFERIGPKWATTYAPDGVNYQGDPRWFPSTVGATVAAHLGFFQVSQSTMLAPTADYANRAIEKFNQKLDPEYRIEMRFRETGEEPLEGAEYLRDFRNNILPIAKLGVYAVHDHSYHFISVLYPKRVLDIARTRIDLTLAFRKWVDRLDAKNIYERNLLREVADAEIQRRVKWVDSSSGSLGYLMALFQLVKTVDGLEKMQKYVLGQLFSPKHSAVSDVRSLLFGRINAIDRHAKADREKAKALVTEFLSTFTEARYHEKIEITVDEFLAELTERMQAWQRAAITDGETKQDNLVNR